MVQPGFGVAVPRSWSDRGSLTIEEHLLGCSRRPPTSTTTSTSTTSTAVFFCGLLLRRRPQLSSIWWTSTEAMIYTMKAQDHCSSAAHGRHHPRSRHRQLLSCGLCLPQDHDFRSGLPAAAGATITTVSDDSLYSIREATGPPGGCAGFYRLCAFPPSTTPSAVPQDAPLHAQETLLIFLVVNRGTLRCPQSAHVA